jgi:hypothetical protein
VLTAFKRGGLAKRAAFLIDHKSGR